MGGGWKTQPKSLLLRPFKASTTYIYTTAVLWWQTLILLSYLAEREAIGEERRDMDLIIVDFMIIHTNDSRCQALEDPVTCFRASSPDMDSFWRYNGSAQMLPHILH